MTTSTTSRIWLTLLLAGGHRESLSVDASSPLLDKIREALAGELPPCIFEVPIKEGAGLLTLHSTQIVGAITEPPIPLSLPPASVPAPAESAAVAAVQDPAPPVTVSGAGFEDGLHVAHAVRVPNVLNAEQHSALLAFASRNRQLFTASTTTSGAPDYRDSLVCNAFAPFDELLRRRVRLLLPKVGEQLGFDKLDDEIEIQLTAHNHGQFYRVHNDCGNEGQSRRVLSFVYYFQRSPQGFTGGELRLYDREITNGRLRAASTYKDIEPLDNSLVLFDSRDMHEVRPVSCQSMAFADSRFTVNGWVLRPA